MSCNLAISPEETKPRSIPAHANPPGTNSACFVPTPTYKARGWLDFASYRFLNSERIGWMKRSMSRRSSVMISALPSMFCTKGSSLR